MSTSSLLPTALLNPRALMAYCTASTRATCRLGARRRASGRVLAPDRRISSELMTKIEAGALPSFSVRLETEVTSTCISSSSESFLSDVVDWASAGPPNTSDSITATSVNLLAMHARARECNGPAS